MLRNAFLISLLAVVALACGDDDTSDSTPAPNGTNSSNTASVSAASDTPSATLTPFPTGPTPTATPSEECIFITLGVCGRVIPIPTLPSGLISVTNLVEFETDEPNTSATIGLPVTDILAQGIGLAWWTYTGAGEWQQLDDEIRVEAAAPPGEGGIVTGDFDPLPDNLIALAES